MLYYVYFVTRVCIMHISMSFRTNLNQFPLMEPFRDTERLGTTFLCSWALSLLENQTFKGPWSLYNILQVVLWPNHQRVWWLESHQVPRPGVHWSGIWSCHIKRVAGAASVIIWKSMVVCWRWFPRCLCYVSMIRFNAPILRQQWTMSISNINRWSLGFGFHDKTFHVCSSPN